MWHRSRQRPRQPSSRGSGWHQRGTGGGQRYCPAGGRGGPRGPCSAQGERAAGPGSTASSQPVSPGGTYPVPEERWHPSLHPWAPAALSPRPCIPWAPASLSLCPLGSGSSGPISPHSLPGSSSPVPLTRFESTVGVAGVGQFVLPVIGLAVRAVTPGQATLQVGLHDALHRWEGAGVRTPTPGTGSTGVSPRNPAAPGETWGSSLPGCPQPTPHSPRASVSPFRRRQPVPLSEGGV